MQQLNDALARLQAAYRSGDFAAIGQAQADVQRLTTAYLKSQSTPPATPSPKPSPSPSYLAVLARRRIGVAARSPPRFGGRAGGG